MCFGRCFFIKIMIYFYRIYYFFVFVHLSYLKSFHVFCSFFNFDGFINATMKSMTMLLIGLMLKILNSIQERCMLISIYCS
ncbi:hypothetical protein J2X05_002277 [Cellvibrio fibrivorans]|uniref:Uncharacterized protein n=1 Tax=Cellvibrio fibrivorans TaxID=126350 RepID=A0ABU1UYH1_9GAMM|nr:hypothetical protein [Cellvibrio fibrivorans]